MVQKAAARQYRVNVCVLSRSTRAVVARLREFTFQSAQKQRMHRSRNSVRTASASTASTKGASSNARLHCGDGNEHLRNAMLIGNCETD